MSCDAIAAAAVLGLASNSPIPAAAATPPPAAVATSVAQEPLFMDIVRRAGVLKGEVEGMKTGSTVDAATLRKDIEALAALDMQGHVALAERGTDGDLKCILKVISQDLPLKLTAIEAATTPKARDMALTDMAYLLNDNVEVITAPPTPPA